MAEMFSSKRRKLYTELHNQYSEAELSDNESTSHLTEKISTSKDLEFAQNYEDFDETEITSNFFSEICPKQGLMHMDHKSRSRPVEKMPSEAELEEFFAAAEKCEQQRFAEKYNYDIVKDVPLEGKYQWVQL